MSSDPRWTPLPAPFKRGARVRYQGAGDPEHPWLRPGMEGVVKRTWRGTDGDAVTERPPVHGSSIIWFAPDATLVATVRHDQAEAYELVGKAPQLPSVQRELERPRQKEEDGPDMATLERMDLPEWIWQDGAKAACWYLLMAPVMIDHIATLGYGGVRWLSRSADDLEIDWDTLAQRGSGGVEALVAFARAWWDQVPVDLELWLRLDDGNRARVLRSFEIRQRGGAHALRLLQTEGLV